MEKFKIENFEKKEGRRFPWFRTVDEARAQELRASLASRLGLPEDANGIDLLERLVSIAVPRQEFDANSAHFNLLEAVMALTPTPMTHVYINWNRFDNIDYISLRDLSDNFDDIRYPSSDDIDVFDETLSWVVSVRHYGTVLTAKLEDP